MADETVKTAIVNRILEVLGQELSLADLSDASLANSNAARRAVRTLDDQTQLGAITQVLERHGWCCALQDIIVAPTQLPGPCDWRYPWTYVLPADFVRIWEVSGYYWPGYDFTGPDPRFRLTTTNANGSEQRILRVAPNFFYDGPLNSLFPFYGPIEGPPVCNPPNPPDPGDPQADAAFFDGQAGNLPLVYVRRVDYPALTGNLAEYLAQECAARIALAVTGSAANAKQIRADAEMALAVAVSADATQEGGQPPWAPSIPMALRAYSRF